MSSLARRSFLAPFALAPFSFFADCSCGGASAPVVPPKIVVVLGSSTAAGTGASAGHPWAALFFIEFPSNDAAAGSLLDEVIGPFPRAFFDQAAVALVTGLRDGVHLNEDGQWLIAERVLASAGRLAVCET